jgi:adenylate cyclase
VRRETVAVLFADIVGFTRMAERMPPEAVMAMLREFHQRMTAAIFACGGTVEKYIGDAILAVFGLPHASAQDAANALRCADRMLAALEVWNRDRELRDEPPLAIGIGLNYGPAVIGDVGSDQGLSFTVIGDTVNTASRLQGLTRSLTTLLVASDALVVAARNASMPELEPILPRLEDRGEQSLRGRSEPVHVWIGRPSVVRADAKVA